MTSGSLDDLLWGDYSTNTAAGQFIEKRGGTGELDKDAFLRLLLTELQYQDPLNPMDDKSFVAQMAQFTALEQMQNVSKTTSLSQGYSMVGKYVSGTSYNESTGSYAQIAGRVESVRVVKGEALLMIGDKQLKLSEVEQVLGDNYSDGLLDSINGNILGSQGVSIVGKYVQALEVDEEGNLSGFIEGKVDNVRFSNGLPILMVGGKVVMPGRVLNVSDQPMLIGVEFSAFTGTESEAYGLKTGVLTQVRVVSGKMYAVMDDKYECEIGDIDSFMQSLKAIGAKARADGKDGVITGAYLTGGDAMVTVNGKEYKFEDIKLL